MRLNSLHVAANIYLILTLLLCLRHLDRHVCLRDIDRATTANTRSTIGTSIRYPIQTMYFGNVRLKHCPSTHTHAARAHTHMHTRTHTHTCVPAYTCIFMYTGCPDEEGIRATCWKVHFILCCGVELITTCLQTMYILISASLMRCKIRCVCSNIQCVLSFNEQST